jgi:hypothetical protein
MKVRSLWMESESFCVPVKVGMPIIMLNPRNMRGEQIGKVDKIEGERALVILEPPRPWQTLEQWGFGFSQFEDTEDSD